MSRKVIPGDVICVSRTLGYDHYGIYSGNGRVIHYATDFNARMAPFIHEVSLSEFLDGDDRFLVCEFMPYYEGKNHKEVVTGLADKFSVPLASIISIPSFGTFERIRKSIEYKLYTPSETLERARGQVKKVEDEDFFFRAFKGTFSMILPDEVLEPSDKFYWLSSNNCEHFVTWCKTGVFDSMQINEIAALISVTCSALQ